MEIVAGIHRSDDLEIEPTSEQSWLVSSIFGNQLVSGTLKRKSESCLVSLTFRAFPGPDLAPKAASEEAPPALAAASRWFPER